MDDILGSILAPSKVSVAVPKSSRFIPSRSFAGYKEGFIFTTREQGTGYYDDVFGAAGVDDGADATVGGRKRVRDEFEKENKELTVDELLEKAEESGIVALDATSLKHVLLTLEKKVSKNQQMRTKYFDAPEKFLESEIDLHAAIQEIYAIAASPELYPNFIEANGLSILLGLITHENADISLAVVGLIQEMMDAEVIGGDPDAIVFLHELLKMQGLELLVQNLSRLDETNEEDAQGVYNTMAIIENMIDLDDTIAVTICEKTHILKFLLMRLKVRKFDANKLYCSEMLSILMQADESNHKRLCNIQGMDGMDALLQCLAPYRKRDPASSDEQECIHNLFLSLRSILLEESHQNLFMLAEGFELMCRCLSEQKYSAICALRVISFAITGQKDNCKKLVDVGGMKYVFPILLGRGLPKIAHNTSTSGGKAKELKEAEKTAVSIVATLCTQLYDSRDEGDYFARVLSKFLEKEGEKLDRCIELFTNFAAKVQATESAIERTMHALEREGDEEALEEYLDDDNIYLQRLEGGLVTLQQLATIIAFVCSSDPSKNAIKKTNIRLAGDGMGMGTVLAVLSENAERMSVSDGITRQSDDAIGGSEEKIEVGVGVNGDEEVNEDKILLESWISHLSAVESEG